MDVALVILDGWGLGVTDDPAHRNAVATARTPTFDRLEAAGASNRLTVSGRDVGLPAGQMGNSQVGHLNIGAGRVVYQEYTRISDAIAAANFSSISWKKGDRAEELPDPPFDQNPVVLNLLEQVAETGGRLHLLGLISDGGVHADYRHLFAVIELAASHDVDVVTHAFSDGRDASPKAGRKFLSELEAVIDEFDTGAIRSVTGRYFAMDRNENWDRTVRAFDAIANATAPIRATSADEALERSYQQGITDEFVKPTLIQGGAKMAPRDAVFFANFRADRARQLTRMLANRKPDLWERVGIEIEPPSIPIATITRYDDTFALPVAFEPIRPTEPLGEVLEAQGRSQLRIAESEKYAHVTYFLNGGREHTYEGEIRRIIPSLPVATYDLAPEMRAREVTDTAIEIIESDDPDVMVLNFANPDMVGHTGDFKAAVSAVETVDTELARLAEAIQHAGGDTIITADHGNAEDMGSPEQPHTAHTTNDVPVCYLDASGGDGGQAIRSGGRLADLAPTLLSLCGITPPNVMTGRSLLVSSEQD